MTVRMFAVCAAVALSVTIGGCNGNGYADFYKPNSAISPEDLARRRFAAPPSEPELLHGSDTKGDVAAALAEGYAVVGSSSFEGPQASDASAVAQAKVVGADRVVVFNKYSRTAQGVLPITTPTTQTSFSTGSANAFGNGGMATAFGSATTTTFGTEANYIPISIDRYDFLAVYLVKVKFSLGAGARDLNAQEAQGIGSVNGVVVTSVVYGSPAASAGLVPGDIITEVDGRAIAEHNQFFDRIKELQGKSVSLTVVRATAILKKTVKLATF